MEKRDLNIAFYKSGSGSISTRITLPKKWIEKMEISLEEREVEVVFNDDIKEITIRKK